MALKNYQSFPLLGEYLYYLTVMKGKYANPLSNMFGVSGGDR